MSATTIDLAEADDPYVAELLERIQVAGANSNDLGRLALRYADIGMTEQAVAVFNVIHRDSTAKGAVAQRLAPHLDSEQRRETFDQIVVPSSRALGDAFRFAGRLPGLVVLAAGTLAAWLPVAVLGNLGGGVALGVLWFALIVLTLAASLRTVGSYARLPDDGVKLRPLLKRFRAEAGRSVREYGVVLGLACAPGILLSLVLPLAAGILGLATCLYLAAVLPGLLEDPGPHQLHPARADRIRRRRPEDFRLLLAVGSLLACATMVGLLVTRMGPAPALFGTVGVLVVALALVRLAATTLARSSV